jgi:hypothetical protein
MRDINYLRQSLLDAMDKLMDGKIDIATAKAMADLGQVLVNSAKIEADLMSKADDFNGTGFMRNINPKTLGHEK